jgi:hypothetical protein
MHRSPTHNQPRVNGQDIIASVSKLLEHREVNWLNVPSACSTTVNVELSFGGATWSISPADFAFTQTSSTECIGAFFEASTGAGAPSWIIGDAFLVCGNDQRPPSSAILSLYSIRKMCILSSVTILLLLVSPVSQVSQSPKMALEAPSLLRPLV